MFRYLRRDHIQHCVPSNVSSGLATLPLSFVYVNNIPIKSRPTNKSLPTGELLNGKKSYQQIVSYFTTNTMSPDDIHDLGFKMLKELYPQVGDGILKFVIMNCWNRPFVTNDHMVQNPPCWRASSLLFPHWDIKTKVSQA